MSQRKAREMAMQMLFQHDMAGSEDPEGIPKLFWTCHPASAQVREYAERLYAEALRDRERVDGLIRKFARHWKLDRIAPVERNILRVAIVEFLVTDTPRAVILDEAIEISRKFGSERSSEFVNGILDAITENAERSPV